MKNITLKDQCARYTLADEVRAQGIYPYYRPISSGQDPVVKMADGREVLMFGSNSYLGLSDDPRLKEAAIKAIEKYGTSCSGSRFLNGTLDIHEELEAKLARFVGKEEAVTYSTGFQVNLGVVSCLSPRGSFVFGAGASSPGDTALGAEADRRGRRLFDGRRYRSAAADRGTV